MPQDLRRGESNWALKTLLHFGRQAGPSASSWSWRLGAGERSSNCHGRCCSELKHFTCSNPRKLQVRVRSSTDGVAVFLVACRTKPRLMLQSNAKHTAQTAAAPRCRLVERRERCVLTSQDLFSYANAAALLRRCLGCPPNHICPTLRELMCSMAGKP